MSSIILSQAAQTAWRETGYERWECKETGRMVAVGLSIAGVKWRFVSVYAPDRVEPAWVKDLFLATRHDGVLFNQCYFMLCLDKQTNEVCCKGPPPPGPLRGRWRCEVASGPLGGAAEVAHGGSPRHLQQLVVRSWPTYPPTHVLQRTQGCA